MTDEAKMDVDSPKDEEVSTKQQPIIAVHPLAIVHMTDQHTRVTCGGSRFDVHSPVVGLLLGRLPAPSPPTTTSPTESPVVTVLEADDIPLDMSDATHRQVALHRAVFPFHSVVGWYRVVSESGDEDDDEEMDYQPTEDDVRLTRDLKQFFQKQQTPSDSEDVFLFALLHIPVFESAKTTKEVASQQEEPQLPLNLFRLYQNSSLVGLEYNHDWKLETSEPERVAIERVIREKPTAAAAATSSTTTTTGTSGTTEEGGGQPSVVDSSHVSHAQSLQHSLEAMQQRIHIIMEYLASISPSETATTTTATTLQTTTPLQIAPNPALLRQIQALVSQLGLLAAAASSSSSSNDSEQANIDASLLAQLATVSKAVCAIQSYTEKLQAIQEHRSMSSSASSGGGGGGGGALGSSASSTREDRRRRH